MYRQGSVCLGSGGGGSVGGWSPEASMSTSAKHSCKQEVCMPQGAGPPSLPAHTQDMCTVGNGCSLAVSECVDRPVGACLYSFVAGRNASASARWATMGDRDARRHHGVRPATGDRRKMASRQIGGRCLPTDGGGGRSRMPPIPIAYPWKCG
jgi:hypothetical protein